MRTGPNTDRATTDHHGAAAGPNGPTGRRHAKRIRSARPPQARRETRYTMATIAKLRNKIENVSALKGWRMRWHMQ